MLHIYIGRENAEKANFIFGNAGKNALIVVPDQFTLEAEREAIRCLDSDGLMDMEIISISRLGLRILEEVGGIKKARIDKYGRHILLSSIITDLAEKGEIDMYQRLAGRNSFVDLVNNFIADLKQYGITPEKLTEIQEEAQDRSILSRKLAAIGRIYSEYENRIAGKYVDTEDYIDLYVPNAGLASCTRDKEIWVWGFDTFAPKNYEFILQLAAVSDVRLVLTGDLAANNRGERELFSLTVNLAERLKADGQARGIDCEIKPIEAAATAEAGFGAAGGVDGAEAGADGQLSPGMVLEKSLFATPLRKTPGYTDTVTIVSAANYYSEAESAAVYVTELIRDKGLRLRDILLVCNDLDTRAHIIRRVFAEYGLTLFTDEKSSITENPQVVYILALLRIMRDSSRTRDIISLVKTGLTPLTRSEAELLENYVTNYRIVGKMWKEPFKYGTEEYRDRLDDINAIREKIMEVVNSFESAYKPGADESGRKTVSERMEALYNHISGKHGYKDKITEDDDIMVFNAITGIIDQIVNIAGQEKKSMKDLEELMLAGLSGIETGSLPPGSDGLVLGTMQRTRAGQVKALVVLGANDGILPRDGSKEELLSEDEKIALKDKNIEVSGLESVKNQEEKLGIYRMMSGADNYFYISYAGSDDSGEEIRPSIIFEQIKNIFCDVEVLKDVDERGGITLVQHRNSSMNHLVRSLRDEKQEEYLPELIEWYKENDAEFLENATEGLFYKNRTEKLRKDVVDKIYGNEMTISPSRFERFSRCPFDHFVQYVLKPKEQRVFEAGKREVGDVYHHCLMKYSIEVTGREENAAYWNSITRDESDALIETIMNDETDTYKEGLMKSGGEEMYRQTRMLDTLKDVAWALALQAKTGSIQNMFLEELFGRDDERKFPSFDINVSGGTVHVEGQIDRVDVHSNNSVKIIDYKSGHEEWSTEEARKGYRLQLMLYLKAASQGLKEGSEMKPAGVFYFHIAEPRVKAESSSGALLADEVEKEIKKQFRMSGIVIGDSGNVQAVTGDLSVGEDSDVVSGFKIQKNGIVKGLLTEDEFEKFTEEFDQVISDLADNLITGDITARPKKVKDRSKCDFCSYRSICRFETIIDGCRYEKI